ncbi:MAG: SDR family NAD(P)-dependent oxidoreductase [Methylococcaceae bacterium]|jgi:short-subunit dehydrogenase
MRAIVVGASAGVGRALAEALAADGAALLLVASDLQDLEANAMHLRLSYNVDVYVLAVDATNLAEYLAQVSHAIASFGAVDSVFFPIGVSYAEDCGLLSLDQICALINSNLTAVISLTTQLLPQLLDRHAANIVGFGSIAAIRGRRSNMVYSAAKRGLESYFESLRHATVHSQVRIQFYRLGYVATQQSFGQRLLFPVVSPQQVAKAVIANLNKDLGKVFFPGYWTFVALAVSWLPWHFYKKLNF